jgi:hypothetical protein
MALATRPKPKTYHKKRQAQHHRLSKRYLKSYWPYLPMLLIVGVGLAINSLWASQSTVLDFTSDFSSQSLLDQTNSRRANAGQAALSIDPQLNAAAQAKADDMARRDYWSHISPDGRPAWSFIAASGYQYQAAGENLAYGFNNAGDTVTAWMNSPSHRANLLSGAYRHVGFGVAQSPNYTGHGPETIIVAEYAAPVTATLAVQNVNGAATETPAKPVARVQLLAGSQSWVLAAVIAITSAAFTLFLVRHGLRLRRLVMEGETFIIRHPTLDIAIVSIITIGVLLTRTGGIIR